MKFRRAVDIKLIVDYIVDYYVGILFFLLMVGGIALPLGARSLVTHMVIFSILATGYDLCLGFTKQLSLAHSVFFGIGGYVTAFSILYFKVDLLPSLLLGVMAGLILAMIIGVICVRLSEVFFAILTAIFFSIFYLLAIDMAWLTGGDDGRTFIPGAISLGFVSFSPYDPLVNYYFILIFLIATYLFLNRIIRSPLGRIFVSIRENEKRMQFLGYNVFRYKLIAFILSGTFAALSGSLYALTLRYVSADFFTLYWSLMPIIWCLIGGSGTLVGPWIGVLIMSLLQYYVSTWWTYYMILFGIVILIILRVSPKGILGSIKSKGGEHKE